MGQAKIVKRLDRILGEFGGSVEVVSGLLPVSPAHRKPAQVEPCVGVLRVETNRLVPATFRLIEFAHSRERCSEQLLETSVVAAGQSPIQEGSSFLCTSNRHQFECQVVPEKGSW